MAKLGVISQDHVPVYNEYINRLRAEFTNVNVIELSEHKGFAMAVREGLIRCTTDYCLVLQHDRSFCRPVENITCLLDVMDGDTSIRYVGFNTFKSAQHDKTLDERYGLLETFTSLSKPLGGSSGSELLPLLFWYDSNHIAHVKRYLEIYQPFLHAPDVVRENFGGAKGVKSMLLRSGDFIEDRYGWYIHKFVYYDGINRFGQAQRNMIVELHRRNATAAVTSLIRWYGAYLLWTPVAPGDDKDSWRRRVVVRHLGGRKSPPPSRNAETEGIVVVDID
jgi:hypothetical protein